jgi:hypothetical protein
MGRRKAFQYPKRASAAAKAKPFPDHRDGLAFYLYRFLLFYLSAFFCELYDYQYFLDEIDDCSISIRLNMEKSLFTETLHLGRIPFLIAVITDAV